MTDDLGEAVVVLAHLLELGRTTTTAVDQSKLDAVVDELAPKALADVERLTFRLEERAQFERDRKVAQDEQAVLSQAAEEERVARGLTQEEDDQRERDERHAAGIS